MDNGTESTDFDGLKRSRRNKKDTGMDEPLPPRMIFDGESTIEKICGEPEAALLH